jgi:hypothetical protein
MNRLIDGLVLATTVGYLNRTNFKTFSLQEMSKLLGISIDRLRRSLNRLPQIKQTKLSYNRLEYSTELPSPPYWIAEIPNKDLRSYLYCGFYNLTIILPFSKQALKAFEYGRLERAYSNTDSVV